MIPTKLQIYGTTDPAERTSEKLKIDRFELEDIEFKYQRLSKVLECIQMAEVEGSGLTDHCLEYAMYDVIEGMWDNNKRLKKIVDEIAHGRSEQPEAAPL